MFPCIGLAENLSTSEQDAYAILRISKDRKGRENPAAIIYKQL
jgi:hypothetical protein